MRKLSAYSNFGDFATRPTLDLADRLAELAPVEDAKIFGSWLVKASLIPRGAEARREAAEDHALRKVPAHWKRPAFPPTRGEMESPGNMLACGNYGEKSCGKIW